MLFHPPNSYFKKVIILFFIIIAHEIVAQEKKWKTSAELVKKEYSYLCEGAKSIDTIQSKIYAKAWVNKAKSNNDFIQLVHAYKSMLYKSDKKLWLNYADSMLVAAKKTTDDILIGSAYMTKATVFYGIKENKKALDNFILADEYIVKTNDSYSIYKVKYGIGQTKYYLGFYDEAISLFKECVNYFKEENDRAYLNSLHYIGLCYNRLGKYDLCSATNQLGLKEGQRLENSEMTAYFIHSEGVNQFGKHNYHEVINKLTNTLPHFIKNKDFANETVTYFYLGKSYWQLKEQKKAVAYFKKVNAIFDEHKYIRPDLRESYELLIDYYKKNNDTESQLIYINKLLQVDHILNQNYKYLLKKVVKEYDTGKLLKAKQDIEEVMKLRTIIGFGIFSIMAMVILFLVSRHFKNKRLFEELMKRDTTKREVLIVSEENNKQTTQEISPDIEAGIIKNLEKFERNKKYLEKDMNLVKMATLLNTNTKYVTKIIVKHRGKGTIDYITNLKIDYIIELLKKENKYRNYTNKALGEEAGFGSTQNFTRAFNAQTGISPTYFIYQLKKSINTGDLK